MLLSSHVNTEKLILYMHFVTNLTSNQQAIWQNSICQNILDTSWQLLSAMQVYFMPKKSKIIIKKNQSRIPNGTIKLWSHFASF